MTVPNYRAQSTAILLVDPYNDFLSKGGKLWERTKDIAEKVNLLDNLRNIIADARKANVKIYFVPHHRWSPGDYIHWKHATPYQLASNGRKTFEKHTWGGTFHDDFQVQRNDILIAEHWGSSGFANTDLDHQLSGGTMARIGLRMMPPFPSSPLRCRTAGFPSVRLQSWLVRQGLP